MLTGWKAKLPIYDLVKSLTWNSSQEMTDRIWGRFAWVVRTLLSCRFSILIFRRVL
jgi:hypothetical protein